MKLDDLVVYHAHDMTITAVKLPRKPSYINFKVEDNFLDAYGMWKNNIFLNKRSSTLSVVSSIFARFSEKQLREVLEEYGSNDSYEQQEK